MMARDVLRTGRWAGRLLGVFLAAAFFLLVGAGQAGAELRDTVDSGESVATPAQVEAVQRAADRLLQTNPSRANLEDMVRTGPRQQKLAAEAALAALRADADADTVDRRSAEAALRNDGVDQILAREEGDGEADGGIDETVRGILSTCWACAVVGRFAEMSDGFARETYERLADVLRPFLYALFMLWFVLQATKLLLPTFSEPPLQVVKNMALRSILFIVVLYFATSNVVPTGVGGAGSYEHPGGNAFFEWGPRLVLSEGISGAETVTNVIELMVPSVPRSKGTGTSGLDAYLQQGGQCGAFTTLAEMRGFMGSTGAGPRGIGGGIDGISQDELYKLTCVVERMTVVSSQGLLLGWSMLTELRFSIWDLGGEFFATLIAALGLIFVFVIALIAFPFYFLDVIFQIYLISALAPLFFVMLLFQPTRGMAFGAAKQIVVAGVQIIGMGLVYGLAAAMMSFAPLMIEGHGDGAGARNWVTLLEAVDAGTMEDRLDLVDSAYWYILMAGVLLLMLMKKMTGLINGLFGGASENSMGMMAQKATGEATKAAFKGAGTVGGLVAGGAAAGAGYGIFKMVRGGTAKAGGAADAVQGKKEATKSAGDIDKAEG